MGTIFISHASEDNAAAERMSARLREHGFDSLFLDFSEEQGLAAGSEWERELYRKLRSCRCLVALCTETWLSSKWCFAEVAQARALGKPVFPVLLDDVELGGLLDPQQAVDLRPTADHAAGYRRLCAGLDKAGILKGAWNRRRSPYPGLSAFEEEDQAVFFGREGLTEEALSRLTTLRRRQVPRWFLLLGASGSGKSSLLRAGLLPRIRVDEEHWLPVGPIRPGGAGMEQLAHAFSVTFARHGAQRDWKVLHAQLRSDSPAAWSELAFDLRASAKRPEAQLLLIVDQLEELLALGDIEDEESAASHALLRTLRGLSDLKGAACFVLGTLRSDFLGAFQQHAALRGLGSDELVIKPLVSEAIARVITGPAQLAGIGLAEGLVDAMVRDTETQDALPLLAFTLRELYERHGGDGLLEVREYRDELGGLQRAVAKAAEDVLCEEQRRLSAADLTVLRAALLSLVRLSDEGASARRRVRWASLAKAIHPSLEAFVRARLLVSHGDNAHRELEVAHEALFREWPALSQWIHESKAFLAWRKRLDPLVERWQQVGRRGASLLAGPELAEGLGWLGREPLLLGEAETAFIAASKAAERARRRLVGGTVVVVMAVLALLTTWALLKSEEATRQGREAKKQEAEAHRLLGSSYLEQGRQMVLEGRAMRALPFLVAARTEGLGSLPLAQLFAVALNNSSLVTFRHSEVVNEAAFSPDGARVVTASDDKTARVWDAATGKPLTPPLLHQDEVSSAAFSPDGTRVITASNDKTARVWDAATGKPLAPPLLHEDTVNSAAFSPDGARIVTASNDKTARVWDAVTGEPLTFPLRHEHGVWSAAFSADGTRVVTASNDKTARVWNAATGKPLTPPLRHGDLVWSAVFSTDGARVVTASEDKTARVWDVATGKPLTPPLLHEGTVYGAVFNADGARVVTASWDNTARVWDATTGKPLTPPLLHEGRVFGAAFSADGARAVTASEDNTVRVWDAATGKLLTRPLLHDGPVFSAVFSPDGARVVTASWDKSARIWRAVAGTPHTPPLLHGGTVNSAAFSPDGAHIVTASSDNTARVWDAATGKPLTPPLLHEGPVFSAAFSPNGARVVTACWDNGARVWDAATGKSLTPPLLHEGTVYSAAFSPDGARIVTASQDKTARVWNATTGKPLTPSLFHEDQVSRAVFSPDGARIVTASEDKTARVWDVATGKQLTPPLLHERTVSSAVFSPDGARVVTASWDKTARVWDAATGKPLTPPLLHEDRVYSAAFSPDGTRVVTATNDGEARVWDSARGKPLTPPLLHARSVSSAAFSPDGARIVTTSWDNAAHVWDAATGKPLAPPLLHEGPVSNATFSPDGARIVTASEDKTARVWDVPAHKGTLAEWRALAMTCSDFVLIDGLLAPNPTSQSSCPANRDQSSTPSPKPHLTIR